MEEKRHFQTKLVGDTELEWNGQEKRLKKIAVSTKKKHGEKRVIVTDLDIASMKLEDFIDPIVHKIASHYGYDLLNTNFEDDNYINMRERLSHLSSVNDGAERAVRIATLYNNFGPRNEQSHQNMLHTVTTQRHLVQGRTKHELSRATSSR